LAIFVTVTVSPFTSPVKVTVWPAKTRPPIVSSGARHGLLASDAEDLTQDVCAAFLETIGRFEGRS
jgi:hypothetical protein